MTQLNTRDNGPICDHSDLGKHTSTACQITSSRKCLPFLFLGGEHLTPEPCLGQGTCLATSAAWEMVDWASVLVSGLLIQRVLYPLLARNWLKDRKETSALAEESAGWLLLWGLVIMFVLGVETDRLIPFVYGPSYGDAIGIQRGPLLRPFPAASSSTWGPS